MYMDVDRQCIQPGIVLVSKLNITNVDEKVSDEAYLQKSKQELSTFCKTAETTVRTVVQEVSRNVTSTRILPARLLE